MSQKKYRASSFAVIAMGRNKLYINVNLDQIVRFLLRFYF